MSLVCGLQSGSIVSFSSRRNPAKQILDHHSWLVNTVGWHNERPIPSRRGWSCVLYRLTVKLLYCVSLLQRPFDGWFGSPRSLRRVRNILIVNCGFVWIWRYSCGRTGSFGLTLIDTLAGLFEFLAVTLLKIILVWMVRFKPFICLAFLLIKLNSDLIFVILASLILRKQFGVAVYILGFLLSKVWRSIFVLESCQFGYS